MPYIKDNDELRDELGRDGFAKVIAEIIQQHTASPECKVIGLEGAWGEGKTYTKGLILKNLEKLPKHKEIACFEFNPWSFRDHNHLSEIFLAEFGAFLIREKETNFEKYRRVSLARVLSLLAAITNPFLLFIVAVASIILASVFNNDTLLTCIVYFLAFLVTAPLLQKAEKNLGILTRTSNSLKRYAESLNNIGKVKSDSSIVSAKQKIESLLIDNKFPYKRILVIIEDMDRLTPNEIRSFVQLIRLIANFPKLTYLVAYDREYVIRALGDHAASSSSEEDAKLYGEGYLRKVIPNAHRLPKASEAAISEVILKDYHFNVAAAHGEDYLLTPYWLSIKPILSQSWKTIRDGEQVVDRAKQLLALLSTRSNPADVLVAAHLMTYQPTLWDWLWQNKSVLLRDGSSLIRQDKSVLGHETTNSRTKYIDDYLVGTEDTKNLTYKLLFAAFPSLNNGREARMYSHFNAELEKRGYALGHVDYADSYFQYTPASQNTLLDSLDKTYYLKGEELIAHIRETSNRNVDFIQKYFNLLNDKIRGATDESWRTTELPILVALGIAFDNKHSKSPFAPILCWESYYVAILCINQLPRQKQKDACNLLLSKWLEKDLIFHSLYFVDQIRENKWKVPYHSLSRQHEGEKVFFSEEEQEQILKILEAKTSSWLSNHILDPRESHIAPQTLFAWQRLLPEQANEKISEWVEDAWRLLPLLDILTNESHVSPSGKATYVELRIDPISLTELTKRSISEIKSLVKKHELELPNLTEEYATTIKIIDGLDD